MWKSKMGMESLLITFNEIKCLTAMYDDSGAYNLIIDIINGLNVWLFKVLAGKEITYPQAKSDCLSFGGKLASHLETMYKIDRDNMVTRVSYREYLERDSLAARNGISFMIRSFRSSFRNNILDYAAALTAMLISEKREEMEFERFVRESPENFADVRGSLLSYYINNEVRLVGGKNVAARADIMGAGRGNEKYNKSIFKGFNP